MVRESAKAPASARLIVLQCSDRKGSVTKWYLDSDGGRGTTDKDQGLAHGQGGLQETNCKFPIVCSGVCTGAGLQVCAVRVVCVWYVCGVCVEVGVSYFPQSLDSKLETRPTTSFPSSQEFKTAWLVAAAGELRRAKPTLDSPIAIAE